MKVCSSMSKMLGLIGMDGSAYVWGPTGVHEPKPIKPVEGRVKQCALSQEGGVLWMEDGRLLEFTRGIKGLAFAHGEAVEICANTGNTGRVSVWEWDRLPFDRQRVVGIVGGWKHYVVCVRAANGASELWSVGSDTDSQLGRGRQAAFDGRFGRVATPEGLDDYHVAHLATGSDHSVVVDHQQRVWAWGRNDHGQLRPLEANTVNPPTCWSSSVRASFGRVRLVATGCTHTYFVCDSVQDPRRTKLFATGFGSNGEMGDGLDEKRLWPEPIPYFDALPNIVGIATGYGHSVVALADSTLHVWGCNADGQCGVGSLRNVSVPRKFTFFEGKAPIKELVCGRDSTYALLSDDSLWVWGKLGSQQPVKVDTFAKLGVCIRTLFVGGVFTRSAYLTLQERQTIACCWKFGEPAQCALSRVPRDVMLLILQWCECPPFPTRNV